MPNFYWTVRERIRLNPLVGKSIYIAQSVLRAFTRSEFSTRMKSATKRYAPTDGVALCVRIRDEAPDLREYVEYYLAAGIQHLFFYEARSVDNFREVLKPFVDSGRVTLIADWPHIPISPAAEHDCILRCIGRYAWVGCLDADEFVVIRNGQSVQEFLSHVPMKYPAVALHWRLYGSDGHVTRPNLPITVAYTRRQEEPNLHVKVFVRPERVLFHRNSHSWYYRGVFSTAVNEMNRRVWGSTSVPPTAERAWINHYYYKSLEEFQRKGQRASILDPVGIRFNSRTPQRGAQYERTANQVRDLSAIEYHRRLCNLTDCSICSAIAQTQILDNSENSIERRSGSNSDARKTVSIVICTRFRTKDLRRCLTKIAQQTRRPDELIIVDNSEGDVETERLAREFSATYIIERNIGLSRARNRGLAECNSEIAAFLDDDASPDEQWLEKISEPFSDARVAVVTGAAIDPVDVNSPPQQSQQSSLEKSDSHWFEIAAFGGLGIGTNMALRRSACSTSNLFDERLGRGAPFHGMEEHLAFTKLISDGYRAVYNPSAVVIHSSQNPLVARHEARSQFAYSMLLYSEFPDRRKDLIGFLFRRMRRKPLTWFRNTPDPGIVVSSSWPVLLRAGVSGAMLYLKTRKRGK